MYLRLLIICVSLTTNAYSQDKESQKESNSETELKSESLQWILDDLIIKWQNNKDYCIEVIDAMPEDGFNLIPSDNIQSNSMMTFWEQAVHIATTMHWQMEKLGFNDLPEFDYGSEEALISSYNSLFDYLISELEQMDPASLNETVDVFYDESTKLRLLNLMDNHVAHHRGQMIVYLRMKGVTPPKYRGW